MGGSDKLSRGIGGCGRKILEDDTIVLYEYSSYNLNDDRYRNENNIFDGVITIEKACLVEPEIHEKIKKVNGKKKLIIKRVRADVPYETLFSNGKIKIENSNNCWLTTNEGYDIIAVHLCFRIFSSYQEDGELPEKIGYNV